jgi:hypothetical protein
MRLGGIYNMEPLTNFHWGFMSLSFMRLYHYLVLQSISFGTKVNLNSIMCPAISDPFEGPWYRVAANIHQTFFIILHGKIYCYIGEKFFVPKNERNKPQQQMIQETNNNSDKSTITVECDSSNIKMNKFKYLDANGNNIKQIGPNNQILNNSKDNSDNGSCHSCDEDMVILNKPVETLDQLKKDD